MTYDEFYATSRAFFEARATPKQIALLDSHEKCDGAGFVDSILLDVYKRQHQRSNNQETDTNTSRRHRGFRGRNHLLLR